MAFTTQYIYWYLFQCFRSEAYSEPRPRHRYKMELFAKVVHGFRLISIFVKSSIIDVRLDSEYSSAGSKTLLTFSKNKTANLFNKAVEVK